jgi:uncharacterized protein HemX
MTTPYGQDPRSGGHNPNPGGGGIPTWGPGTGAQPVQPQPTRQQPLPHQPMTGGQPPLNLPPLSHPAKRGNGALIGVGAVAVLALGAAVVFVFLWLGAQGDKEDLDGKYQQQTSALTAAQDGRKKAEADISSAKEDADKARADQRKAESDAASATKCRTAARAFVAAARGTDQNKINQTADDMVAAC